MTRRNHEQTELIAVCRPAAGILERLLSLAGPCRMLMGEVKLAQASELLDSASYQLCHIRYHKDGEVFVFPNSPFIRFIDD